jgi:release factor glutamine methyltransferase
MNLEEFYKLIQVKLDRKFDKNEVEEFFFRLIDHYCQVDRLKYILNSKLELNKIEEVNLVRSIKFLEKESPIQYITGQTQFMGMNFTVNKNVLIPRPETEELVRWIVQDLHSNKRVLDIGTGSGCIATSLSKLMDNCIVFGWDISSDALDIASKNSKNNSVNVKYDLVDITHEKKCSEKFDIIVSNPPYVTQDDKLLMSKNVISYEPHIALFVKENDPLFFYKKILNFSKKNLISNGTIYFEINENFSKQVNKLLKKEGFHDIIVKKDFRGKYRMVKATKK